MVDIKQEILDLKKERGAIILAHNYVIGDLQELADFTGDSLELSIKAQESKAKVIVFCGVRFMAETAKLLSPESTVLLPNPDAGCPMADNACAKDVADYKKNNPESVLVAYVNTTALTKSSVDICCTSGNVEKIIESIPHDKEIMFLPDKNLGANMIKKLNRKMKLWEGCCLIHDKVTPDMIRDARKHAPEALVLVHPECPPAVVDEADYALSTGGILKFVRESDKKCFIIGTETGILYRLRKENPSKKFIPLQPEMICEDMKKITLENLRDSLRDMKYRIELDSSIMHDAVLPIKRMISI